MALYPCTAVVIVPGCGVRMARGRMSIVLDCMAIGLQVLLVFAAASRLQVRRTQVWTRLFAGEGLAAGACTEYNINKAK